MSQGALNPNPSKTSSATRHEHAESCSLLQNRASTRFEKWYKSDTDRSLDVPKENAAPAATGNGVNIEKIAKSVPSNTTILKRFETISNDLDPFQNNELNALLEFAIYLADHLQGDVDLECTGDYESTLGNEGRLINGVLEYDLELEACE